MELMFTSVNIGLVFVTGTDLISHNTQTQERVEVVLCAVFNVDIK